MSENRISLSYVRNMPTVIDTVHESLYRAHMVVQKVKQLLGQEVPHEVIIEIIEDLYMGDSNETTLKKIMGKS